MAGHRKAIGLVAVAALAAAAGLGGCGGSDEPSGSSPSAAAGQRAATALAGVCPETIVVQTNWWPQAEYGALYRLLGPQPQIDSKRKRVSGALVAAGADTGVKLEIRAGGPAIGFVPSAKMLYTDPAITLGGVDIDQAAQVAAEQPVQAVFAPLDLSPLVIMWDPERHPDWNTISDIGQTSAPVLYYQGSTYMDYLVGSGILRKSQVDASYDGTPARFVAEAGAVAQQGYLTNEVYQYEHELAQWKRKIGWTLVADSGYPVYPETLAIRPDRKAELRLCLDRLVPILQRSTVDYLDDPAATNALLVKLVDEFGAFPYSADRAAHAVIAMRDQGIIGNGGNTTVGDFDARRVQRIIEIVRPIFAGQRRPLPADLSPTDLFTSEFVDPAIGVKSK